MKVTREPAYLYAVIYRNEQGERRLFRLNTGGEILDERMWLTGLLLTPEVEDALRGFGLLPKTWVTP